MILDTQSISCYKKTKSGKTGLVLGEIYNVTNIHMEVKVTKED